MEREEMIAKNTISERDELDDLLDEIEVHLNEGKTVLVLNKDREIELQKVVSAEPYVARYSARIQENPPIQQVLETWHFYSWENCRKWLDSLLRWKLVIIDNTEVEA